LVTLEMYCVSVLLELAARTAIAASTSYLASRQLGGGLNDAMRGSGWNAKWPDPEIKAPTEFDAIPKSGCSFDIVFKRDVRD
jgi:hypothetical protein